MLSPTTPIDIDRQNTDLPMPGVTALVCDEIGPPSNLQIKKIQRSALGTGDVRIRVRAAGINYADALVIAGRYQVKPPLPLVPGSECAGLVIEAGAEVQELSVGDRVLAVPLVGCMAEEIVADAADVFRIPDGMTWPQAAGFPITYGTARHALIDRGRLVPGEFVLINGAGGGIGLAATEIAKAAGAVVIASASSQEKLALARKAGADHLIDYSVEDVRQRVREITEGHGADMVCDPVGGNAFDEGLRCLAWGGRILVIGFTSGTIPQVAMNRLLLRGCDAVGVYWGNQKAHDPSGFRSGMSELLEWHRDHRISGPEVQIVRADEVVRILEGLEARSLAGKFVMSFCEEV